MDFPLIIAIAIGIGILSLVSNRQVTATWRGAARLLGVAYQKKSAMAPPRIEGEVEGLGLTIEVRSSGNTKSTRYRVRYPSLGVGLQVTRKTGLSKVSEFLGAQDAETGDEAFDEVFTVKTSDPERLATVFTPPMRQAVRELLVTLPAAKITDDTIVFERRIFERKLDRIVKTARLLLATGTVLAQREHMPTNRVGSSYDDSTPPAPDLFQPWDGLELLAEEPPAEVVSSEEILDSETGEFVTISPPAEVVTSEEILDSETGEFVTISPPAEPSDTVPEPTPDTPPVGPKPLDVADVLFGGHLLSFQMAAIFEERYAGRQIRWNGTVAGRSESGVTVDVGSIDTDLFGPLTVKVIVASAAAARFQPGDAVIVTGTLSGIDGFERTLAVDGELTDPRRYGA
ncbi:MAG: hypothetical protein GXP34_01540 [Actinobacteria bacterium]|nr:hypothetical protein [Actinomycetota bacterium]